LNPVPARKSNTRRERNRATICVVVSVMVCRLAAATSRHTFRRPTVSS
jgi:hypothetical protein